MAKWSELTRIKDLRQMVSPATGLVIAAVTMSCLWVIFEPGIKNFLVVLLVDFIFAQLFLRWISMPPLQKKFPQVFSEYLERSRPELHAEYLNQAFRYPKAVAWNFYYVSMVKSVPGMLLASWLWSPSGFSVNLFFRLAVVLSGYFVFDAFLVYLDNHRELSARLMSLWKQDARWGVAFLKMDLPLPKGPGWLDRVAFGYTGGFLTLQQYLLLSRSDLGASGHLTLKMLTVTAATLAIAYYYQKLSRNFVEGAMSHLSQALEGLRGMGRVQSLAPPTWLVGTRLTQQISRLSEALAQREREASERLRTEVEKSRFEAIGEMTGLVTHDLSNPLHAAQQFIELFEVKNSTLSEDQKDVFFRIKRNVSQANDLVVSLRSHLQWKSDSASKNRAHFGTAYRHVLNTLRVQYRPTVFERIDWDVDPALDPMLIPLSGPDLTHVLDNLLRNAINSTVATELKGLATLRVARVQEAGAYGFSVEDQGAGLSPERFREVTASRTSESSMGLSLIKRLLEAQGGALRCVRPERTGFSTRIEVIFGLGKDNVVQNESGVLSEA